MAEVHMEEVEPNKLTEGEKYFLKWSSQNRNGPPNILVLECEFVYNYDDRYAGAYLSYKDNEYFDNTLIGTIIENDGSFIQHDFDDRLYPYRDGKFFGRPHVKGIGLFKVIDLVKTTAKGNKSPYAFDRFVFSTSINTGNQIIRGETLMWVNLDRVSIIKPIRDKVIALQNTAVKAWIEQVSDVTRDPSGVAEYIQSYLGGRKRKTGRKTTRKSKRNNKRKSKRNRTNKK